MPAGELSSEPSTPAHGPPEPGCHAHAVSDGRPGEGVHAPPIERSGAARQGPDQREAAPAGAHAPGESEARFAGCDREPRQGRGCRAETRWMRRPQSASGDNSMTPLTRRMRQSNGYTGQRSPSALTDVRKASTLMNPVPGQWLRAIRSCNRSATAPGCTQNRQPGGHAEGTACKGRGPDSSGIISPSGARPG